MVDQFSAARQFQILCCPGNKELVQCNGQRKALCARRGEWMDWAASLGQSKGIFSTIKRDMKWIPRCSQGRKSKIKRIYFMFQLSNLVDIILLKRIHSIFWLARSTSNFWIWWILYSYMQNLRLLSAHRDTYNNQKHALMNPFHVTLYSARPKSLQWT